jgi:hypothetical protein
MNTETTSHPTANPRAKRMTIEQHRATGRQLKQARAILATAAVAIPNTYGKTSKPGRLANRPLRALDALRCELDEQLHRDHPRQFDAGIYYGA